MRTGDLQKFKDAGKLCESALGKLGMQYPRWKDMLVHEQKSAILRMLVRGPSGHIASPQLSFFSAIRFRGDDGKTVSSWPDDDNDSLLSSRVSYAWDEKILSAFAVPITDKTKMLEMVEGVAFFSPCKRLEFVFEISDLEGKSRKTDGEVTVLPLEYTSPRIQAASTMSSRMRTTLMSLLSSMKTRSGLGVLRVAG